MKKGLIFLISSVICISLVGCNVKFGIEDRNKSEYAGESIQQSESIEGVNKINIDMEVSEVNVVYYDGNSVQVEGTLGNSSRGLNINKNQDEITINEDVNKSTMLINNVGSKFDIKIPNSYNGDFDFMFGVGDCTIKGIKGNNIKIKAGVGRLVIKDIGFNNLTLNSGVGDTDLDTIEKTGNIDVKGGVGDIDIKLGEVSGNLKYNGGMGDTTIIIPVDSPVKINSTSGLGDCKVTAKTSGDDYTFDVKLGVGSLKISN